jgi:hypothetical protein
MRSLSLGALVALALLALSCVPLASAHDDLNGAPPRPTFAPGAVTVHLLPSASVTIHSEAIEGIGEDVKVSWAGVPSGQPAIVALYVGQPDHWNETAPAKVFVVKAGAANGSTTLFLLNQRLPFVAALYSGDYAHPVLIAFGSPVPVQQPNIPMQLRLAYTANPAEMRVSWTSAVDSSPVVMVGLSADNLDQQFNATSSSYTRKEMCGGPAKTIGWVDPGIFHSAVVTGLKPNTQYFYSVGDASGLSSEVRSFYSAPVQSARTEVDFILFGDLGQAPMDGSQEHTQIVGSIATTKSLQQDLEEGVIDQSRSPAVYHIGDISYARGFAAMWEQFHHQIQNVSSIVPWMTSIGNHERDFPHSGSYFGTQDSGGECGIPYERRFPMPTAAEDKPWYSMRYGPITFVFMSTEHNYSTNSVQWEWMKNTLAAVDRKVTPFLIFAGHRPMYIAQPKPSDPSTDRALLHAHVEPLLLKFKVDVALWGHVHNYQRLCRVNNYACDATNGVLHIVTGVSGAGPKGKSIDPKNPLLKWSQDTYHGYTRGHVRNGTLTLDFVNSVTRKTVDSIVLTPRVHSHVRQPIHAELE